MYAKPDSLNLREQAETIEANILFLDEHLAALSTTGCMFEERRGVTITTEDSAIDPDDFAQMDVFADRMINALENKSTPDNFFMINFVRLGSFPNGTSVIIFRNEKTMEMGYGFFNELIATCQKVTARQMVEFLIPPSAPIGARAEASHKIAELAGYVDDIAKVVA